MKEGSQARQVFRPTGVLPAPWVRLDGGCARSARLRAVGAVGAAPSASASIPASTTASISVSIPSIRIPNSITHTQRFLGQHISFLHSFPVSRYFLPPSAGANKRVCFLGARPGLPRQGLFRPRKRGLGYYREVSRYPLYRYALSAYQAFLFCFCCSICPSIWLRSKAPIISP